MPTKAKEDDTVKMPTEVELAKAREVLHRESVARAAEQRKALEPIIQLADMPEFAKLREAVDNLPPELMTNMAVAPHIQALRHGLAGLAGTNSGVFPPNA